MIANAPQIAQHHASEDGGPVATAVYTMVIVMNEEDPTLLQQEDQGDQQAREKFAAEFQRALDAGFFADLRYDALTFDVPSRVVVAVQPPGGKQ